MIVIIIVMNDMNKIGLKCFRTAGSFDRRQGIIIHMIFLSQTAKKKNSFRLMEELVLFPESVRKIYCTRDTDIIKHQRWQFFLILLPVLFLFLFFIICSPFPNLLALICLSS